MANEFLVSKWKIWYHSLDVNHDGKISMEDVEESRSKFAELHELSDTTAKSVKVDFEGWWNKYILRGQQEIAESEFIDSLNKEFKADKNKFNKVMGECFNEFFDVIDTNKDRSIDESEFLIAFKAYGHENVAEDKSFFQAYSPEKGMVPLRKIVDSWIDFATSEDSSKPSIVKKAFEAGA